MSGHHPWPPRKKSDGGAIAIGGCLGLLIRWAIALTAIALAVAYAVKHNPF